MADVGTVCGSSAAAPAARGGVVQASPRRLAIKVLGQILYRGRSLNDPLEQAQESLSDPRRRALLQELCYGVVRWYPRLDALAGMLLRRPLKGRDRDLHLLILVGMYQLLYTRVPPHAALSETAQVAREIGKEWGVGLVNGVLRSLQRRRDSLLASLDLEPATRHAFPPWLVEALRRDWPEEWESLLEGLNERPPMTLRVNRAKIDRDTYLRRLQAEGLSARPVEPAPDALVLDAPVDVSRLPGFAEGLVSVQDAGAQLAAPLLGLEPGQRVLDACAAPGGKTGHILESAVGEVQLVAVDVDRRRLARVRESLRRLGGRAQVCEGDAAVPSGAWAEIRYDRILLDVPCSATGVIRRHPDIKVLRRAEDIPQLVQMQARILDAVWGRLSPGGRLVYVTCSLLAAENQEQVAGFLRRHRDARELRLCVSWGRTLGHGRQVLPGESTMDGFYYACLEKL